VFQALSDVIGDLLGLGLESHELGWLHMLLRALTVYVIVLAIIRCGHKRFLGKATAFDVILGILLGSVASRAITGNAPFFPTLVACAVLVLLHRIFAAAAFRSPRFSKLVEGKTVALVRDGNTITGSLRHTDITEDDLGESLRMQGVKSVSNVELAQLERNGKVSVIEREREPKLLDIRVESGVQTVRIRVE
jgi:uncharacterized membrane protein YcaP (DUF421 family)